MSPLTKLAFTRAAAAGHRRHVLTASRSPKNTSSSEGSRCALHAVIVFSSICGSCSSRELKIELKLRRRGEARPPFRSGALITSATAFRMRSTPRLTEERVELRDSDSRACIRPLSRRRSDERTVGRGSASTEEIPDVRCTLMRCARNFARTPNSMAMRTTQADPRSGAEDLSDVPLSDDSLATPANMRTDAEDFSAFHTAEEQISAYSGQTTRIDRGSAMRMSATSHSVNAEIEQNTACLLYTSPSPRDGLLSRMPSSA